MQRKPIGQQVVVVFGASSGIGRETAQRLARRGARVVVAARGREGLDSLVEEIRREGGEALAVTADAVDFEQVRNVAERAVERYGRLDTWVHVAAVSLYASLEQTTPAEFRQVLEVNLLGQVHGAMAALPHLRRAGGGALIHVSSVEAQRALPLQSAYAASKHGVHGFLQALRMELEHEGARVSVTEILPATIDTPLFDHARTKIGYKPMGLPPVYAPERVAEAILYAAEHPAREIAVGGAAHAMLLGERLSPRLMDALLGAAGYRWQQTDEPKSADAPDNLFAPQPGLHQAEGSLRRPFGVAGSPNGTARNGAAPWAPIAVGLAAGVLMGALTGRSGR